MTKMHRLLRPGGGIPSWDFNPDLMTFTPRMAKRAMSIFAAAPIVQGRWSGAGIGDTLYFNRGSQISGSFYQNTDMPQGTLVFWMTPEWNGNDGRQRVFYGSYRDCSIYVFKNNVNSLVVMLDDQGKSIDISNWVAGTTYCVVIRWDYKKTLDGTNYTCISVNDVHSFGMTTQPAQPASTNDIQAIGYLAEYPANAVIQGLTIYRRVLWDGAYGVDVGNGDELAAIYNGGAGADPCAVTGSWDVVFCMPTNATAGVLVTGAGEAWSHPHSSNALGNTIGFMVSASAWADWTAVGTPINATILPTNAKVYGWGYQFTANAVGEGYERRLSGLTAGADYVVRAMVHANNSSSMPLLRVWDLTNNSQITALAGTPTSTPSAPNSLLLSFELPTSVRHSVVNNCTAIAIQALNASAQGTVYWHQIELLPNLLDNPSLEVGAVADPWIPYGWSNDALDAGDSERELVIKHSGVASLQYNASALANECIVKSGSLINRFYGIGGWIYGTGNIGSNYRLMRQATLATVMDIPFDSPGAWQHKSGVCRAIEALANATVKGDGTLHYIDDLYLVLLDDVSLTVTPASSANSAESGGIRVDGKDDCYQAIPAGKLFTSNGRVRFRYIPRHNDADAVKFGYIWAYLINIYADDNNYIMLLWTNPSTLALYCRSGGRSLQISEWSTAGAIVAGGNYLIEIRYTATGVQLLVNDLIRLTLTTPMEFTVIPNVAFIGVDDAVYLEP